MSAIVACLFFPLILYIINNGNYKTDNKCLTASLQFFFHFIIGLGDAFLEVNKDSLFQSLPALVTDELGTHTSVFC